MRRSASTRGPIPAAALLAATLVAGCVSEDANTGGPIPRGKQRYPFEEVERNAGQLQEGMTKYQVLVLLGSAAEMDEEGDVWVYLPERPAILLPARALRLEFRSGVLVDHGYHPIVLGKQL